MKCLMLELTSKPYTISHIVRTNDHRGLAIEDRLASVHFDIEHPTDVGAVPDTFEVCAPADQRMQVAEHLTAIFRRADLVEGESQELCTTVAIHRQGGIVHREELQIAAFGRQCWTPGDEHRLRILVE